MRLLKRLSVYGVLVLLLAGVVWFGGMTTDFGRAQEDPTDITAYDATFDVDARGVLHATERITVRFDDDRHGIFRWFDHRDPNAPYSRRVPHDLEITRDGRPEPYEVRDDDRRRKTHVRIGSPDRTLAGEHTYEISYSMDDVLLPAGSGSRFYWNLIAQGWEMDIDKAHLAVRLPGPVSGQVACHVGQGRQGGCSAEPRDGALVVDVTNVWSGRPVTIDVPVGVPAPAKQAPQLWPTRLDGIFGRSTTGVVPPLLAALAALVVGLLVVRRTHEPPPAFPLVAAPPPGIGPAQAAYLLDEWVDRPQLVATLMHAAERGAVTLTRDPDGSWAIERVEGANAELDPLTRGVLNVFGHSSEIRKDNVKSGRRIESATRTMASQAAKWARKGGLMEERWSEEAGCWVVAAPVLLGLVTAIGALWNPFNQSIWWLAPGVLALSLWPLTTGTAGTRRTAKGRELWAQVGGFRRMLSTPSAQDRFDFSSRRELYTAYLPWAVAFRCADAWADKYAAEMGGPPPAPSYWEGSDSGSLVSSLDGTMGSALSAASSFSSGGGSSSSSSSSDGWSSSSSSSDWGSSSSSGGGSSGGGGGGGGGGGSW